jgi:hypothetical protein
MEGYTLAGCPIELNDAWSLTQVENPLEPSEAQKRSLFSGPGLLSMQSQVPALAMLPTEDHISYLTTIGHTQRCTAQTQLDEARQKALTKQKKKDGSPKKSNTTDVLPHHRSDEEEKLRKVVQHELDHYDLSKPDSPMRKRPRPTIQTSNPLGSPQTCSNLKSILKVTNVPLEDLNESSPLKEITIRRTASAKLNYLLSQIIQLSKTEKIIVFSDYGPMMWYLGEALEILGIEHLIYIQRLVLHPQSLSMLIVCRCHNVEHNIL